MFGRKWYDRSNTVLKEENEISEWIYDSATSS